VVCDPQVVKKLEGHHYTVLQLRFSRSGKYLVSVSRDRQMLVFKDGPNGFEKIFGEVVHAKLIYSVDITDDDKYIVTGSRDHTNKVWKIEEEQITNVFTQKVVAPVRSIEFAPCKIGDDYVFWTGNEEGSLELNKLLPNGCIESLKKLTANQNHAGPVNQIRCASPKPGLYRVASCGEDHSLRIYEYNLSGGSQQPSKQVESSE
jgi:elongator complex protein 2